MRKIIRILVGCLLAVLGFAALFIIYLTVTEFRPEEEIKVDLTKDETISPDYSEDGALRVCGQGSSFLQGGETLKVMSWNIGYGGLAKESDFFMDGGKGVRTQEKEQVLENLSAFREEAEEANADFYFWQEVDWNSTRSYHINEVKELDPDSKSYLNAFALNFMVSFVPYPIPPIGRVESGILSSSRYKGSEAVRYAVFCPFKWPVRIANLKRAVLMERLPIEGTDKELVMLNLHLEAFDNGEGKRMQTLFLADLMNNERKKGNYVIAGGDFNQHFSGTDVSMYPKQKEGLWQPGLLDESLFGPGWQFVTDNSVPTCRSLDRPYSGTDPSFQYYMLDGFIVSKELTVEEVRTLDRGFEHSDHNPVILEFTLPG